jgi:hypothetical protein
VFDILRLQFLQFEVITSPVKIILLSLDHRGLLFSEPNH